MRPQRAVRSAAGDRGGSVGGGSPSVQLSRSRRVQSMQPGVDPGAGAAGAVPAADDGARGRRRRARDARRLVPSLPSTSVTRGTVVLWTSCARGTAAATAFAAASRRPGTRPSWRPPGRWSRPSRRGNPAPRSASALRPASPVTPAPLRTSSVTVDGAAGAVRAQRRVGRAGPPAGDEGGDGGGVHLDDRRSRRRRGRSSAAPLFGRVSKLMSPVDRSANWPASDARSSAGSVSSDELTAFEQRVQLERVEQDPRRSDAAERRGQEVLLPPDAVQVAVRAARAAAARRPAPGCPRSGRHPPAGRCRSSRGRTRRSRCRRSAAASRQTSTPPMASLIR